MRILLINNNPIVTKIFALSAKGMEGVEIDEVVHTSKLPHVSYDMLFIDDGDSTDDELEEIIYTIDAKQKILFVSDDIRFVSGIDEIICKPFLPSTIISMLRSSYSDTRDIVEQDIEDLPIENIELADEKRENSGSLILDRVEIDMIKRVLLDSEDGAVEETSGSSDTAEIESIEMEHQMIEALMEMKPKTIKRLLRGAEINITIKFPKEGI